MNEVVVTIEGDRTAFRPGERLVGRVLWTAETAPKAVEVRLTWFTSGKGTRDAAVAWVHRIEGPAQVGEDRFELELPAGPWSFSGTLVSVGWALEGVLLPSEHARRVDLVIAPGAAEFRLPAGPEAPKPLSFRVG